MSRFSWLMALLVSVACPFFARAQIYGNSSLFEPQIDVVSSGVLMDVQATVSADRKYVTMTMRPQNATLLNLRTFQFQGQGGNVNGNVGGNAGGMVGGVNPVIAGTGAAATAAQAVPQAVNAPVRLAPGTGGALIMKRGITPIVLRD